MVFKIFRSKKQENQEKPQETVLEINHAEEKTSTIFQDAAPQKDEKNGFFKRLATGLTKTRQKFGTQLATLLLGSKKLDQALMAQIEQQLIAADVGVSTSEKIIQELTQRVKRKELDQEGVILPQLKAVLIDILERNQKQMSLDQLVDANDPCVILMVGVNGAGKTTSIAKIAHRYKQQGKQIILAAGDTFRAAAVEQLCVWGDRNGVRVIKQPTGSDSASVIFDALSAAQAHGANLVLADTAGRLHTQTHLMRELEKIKKVISKHSAGAPHETLLVVDATLGQNSLSQVKAFHEAIGLTGICLTKLDGTSKGGIVFSIADQCGIPVRFIGVGEGMQDLQPFVPSDFVQALFDAPL
jgi:fused signal recognition particle receptor